MKLSDEQMLDVLREAGHEEAATALEQKMTAQAAVAAGEGDAAPLPATAEAPAATEPVLAGTSRIAGAYASARAAGDAAKRGEGSS